MPIVESAPFASCWAPDQGWLAYIKTGHTMGRVAAGGRLKVKGYCCSVAAGGRLKVRDTLGRLKRE